MKRTHQNAKTAHHIIPRSRVAGKPLSATCKVPEKIHNLSHALHGNRTPEEIIEWYNETLWGGQYEIIMIRK